MSEPKAIGAMVVKNRLVRSATFEGMASEDSSVTDELVWFYKTLAEGGVGLIITGLTYVQPSGKAYPRQIGIHKDDLIPGLRRIAGTVHEHGNDCRVAIQLAHCGFQSLILDDTIAPSAVFEPMTNTLPREMTTEEIEDTIEAFAEAARRAKEAGFDAVQLHAAHGYLLSEFLSPHTNRRTDEYGGNTENRVRIVKRIYKRTVEMTGSDFPILIKMNVDDFLDGGINLSESKKIAKRLSRIGFAAIETSGCMWIVAWRKEEELGWKPAFLPESRVDINSRDKEAYFLPYAREIREMIDVPLILVGGIRSLDVAEGILAEGSADFDAMSRPLIREPNLPRRWLSGTGDATAECISCNSCVGSLIQGSVRCSQKESTTAE
jgi:2,4-dienoyl-CoA reductase-like NADH-dependent reductase (Old Yellow Enzyme family)